LTAFQIANRKSQIANGRRGFTLAESLIASVVLAVAVIGISWTLAASYQQSAVRGNKTTALSLGQQLMEEIASKPMDPPTSTDHGGWSAGYTNRKDYDTIDDYNGYTDVSSALPLNDGNSIDAGDGGSYTRTVTVTQNAVPTGMTGTAADFMLVTVKVAMPHGQSTSLSQLFTRATICR
jgi:prepilin-type N-terminal cleavage/methylation domain-containing protein